MPEWASFWADAFSRALRDFVDGHGLTLFVVLSGVLPVAWDALQSARRGTFREDSRKFWTRELQKAVIFAAAATVLWAVFVVPVGMFVEMRARATTAESKTKDLEAAKAKLQGDLELKDQTIGELRSQVTDAMLQLTQTLASRTRSQGVSAPQKPSVVTLVTGGAIYARTWARLQWFYRYDGEKPARDVSQLIVRVPMTLSADDKPIEMSNQTLVNPLEPGHTHRLLIDVQLSPEIAPCFLIVSVRPKDPKVAAAPWYFKWEGIRGGKILDHSLYGINIQERDRLLAFLGKGYLENRGHPSD